MCRRRATRWIRAAAAVAALTPAAAPAAAPLATEHEQALYAIGVRVGRSLEGFRLDEAELEFVERGMADVALGREVLVNEHALQDRIDSLLRQRREIALAGERAAAEAFLERAAEAEGAVRTGSGLVFSELRPGTGRSPGPDDVVKIHYHGRTRDGSVFDSSVERGLPTVFSLSRVMPCWREGIQRMRVGGKGQVVCPAELAFGDKGQEPRVAGGAAVSYEIELLAIGR